MRRLPAALCASALVLLAACSSGQQAALPKGDCPVAPARVTVSVNQWSDLVRTLAGDCAVVQTVVESTATDPHEFEPTPADTAKITDADLVVVNGLGYDEWATKALSTARDIPSVAAATAAGRSKGDNPHVWYDPDAHQKVAVAVTSALTTLRPGATKYLQQRSAVWAKEQVPYRQAVDRTSMVAKARTYVATEPVADGLAAAVGMKNLTPDGFARATANESEPAPGDVSKMLDVLRSGKVDVLIVNSQVQGQLNDRLLSAARATNVPVVRVTETQPPGSKGFVGWQVQQLDALAEAVTGANQ